MSAYQRFNSIIQDYCSGIYGMERLPLYTLLCKAGVPHILNELSEEELKEVGQTYHNLVPLFNATF